MSIRFQFRLIPAIVTCALVVLGISLAQWQTDRAQQKQAIYQALQQSMQQAPLRFHAYTPEALAVPYTRLKLRGFFVPQQDFYLDNRPMNSQAGYQVLTPFRLSGSQLHLLVVRGWHARDARDRTHLVRLDNDGRELELEGIVLPHTQRVMQFSREADLQAYSLRQNLSVEDLVASTGKNYLPFILSQTSPPAEGLQTIEVVPANQADKHKGYALQWYGLALMALIFFIVTGIRRASSTT